MFERYTEQARRTLFFARYEASVFGSPSITPEHLLLGLLREGHDVADLVPLRVADEIRADMRRSAGERVPTSTSIEIPFTPGARTVIEAAAAEADAFGHPHIGTEHLLLALASTAGTGTDAILRAHNVDTDELRRQIRHRRSPPPAAPDPAGA